MNDTCYSERHSIWIGLPPQEGARSASLKTGRMIVGLGHDDSVAPLDLPRRRAGGVDAARMRHERMFS